MRLPGQGLLSSPTLSCHLRPVEGKLRDVWLCLETRGTSCAENRVFIGHSRRAVAQLGTTAALTVSHASLTPRGKAGRNRAVLEVALPVPFLVPPSAALCPSIHPSLHHHLSLPLPGSGLGEGRPDDHPSRSIPKSCPPSTVAWQGGSTFGGRGRRMETLPGFGGGSGEDKSKGTNDILMQV